MEDHPSVKILEICRVAPPLDVVVPNSLPLTLFDLVWLRFHPIQRLFFYQTSSIHSNIIPILKSSLSLTLRHYLPLAGNLIWPPNSPIPFIHFVQGDAVSLTVAESNADFYHLSSNDFPKLAEEYHRLLPQLPVSHDSASVIALQITLFPNMGFTIGITNHHAILDGTTSTSFLKSWAHITKGSDLSTAPFYDRSVIDDSAGLAAVFADGWLNMDGPNNRSLSLFVPKTSRGLIRCTLELTPQHLQKLKQLVLKQQRAASAELLHVSSFSLTTAYLSVCTAKLKGATSDEKVVIVFAMDVRARLQPPLPSNYFGNCLVARPKFIERCELLGENGMIVALEAISEAIKSVDSGGVMEEIEKWGLSMKEVTKTVVSAKELPLVSIAGSPRFEVYSADFGWGKPKKVEMVSTEFSKSFSLTESRNGDGGLEIGFVKERDEMECFTNLFIQGLQSL